MGTKSSLSVQVSEGSLDGLCGLIALEDGTVWIEVHRVLVTIQVLHHQCVLIVNGYSRSLYERGCDRVPRVDAGICCSGCCV